MKIRKGDSVKIISSNFSGMGWVEKGELDQIHPVIGCRTGRYSTRIKVLLNTTNGRMVYHFSPDQVIKTNTKLYKLKDRLQEVNNAIPM